MLLGPFDRYYLHTMEMYPFPFLPLGLYAMINRKQLVNVLKVNTDKSADVFANSY